MSKHEKAKAIVAKYKSLDEGYDDSLDALIALGYSEKEADDLLHPLAKDGLK
jgi:Holliday junction resolvasome RuvABC DNA-binding subunit